MINEASANIPGWGELAYKNMTEVPHYFEQQEENEEEGGDEVEQTQGDDEEVDVDINEER